MNPFLNIFELFFQEAIKSLQSVTFLSKPAFMPCQRFLTTVGCTMLRAYEFFLVLDIIILILTFKILSSTDILLSKFGTKVQKNREICRFLILKKLNNAQFSPMSDIIWIIFIQNHCNWHSK